MMSDEKTPFASLSSGAVGIHSPPPTPLHSPTRDPISVKRPDEHSISLAMGTSAAKEGKDAAGSAGGGPLRFFFCAGGIFVCYFFYGIVQERM